MCGSHLSIFFGYAREEVVNGMLFPTNPGGAFGMRLIAGEFLAGGELFEDFHWNVLKSFVNEFFADLEIEGGERIGMFDGGFVGFAAHRDESSAEIHKGIVAASAVHDVSGAPERPG